MRAARLMVADRKNWDPYLAQVSMDSLRWVARRIKIRTLEIEIFSKINLPICFPSSPGAIDACNDPLLAKQFVIKKKKTHVQYFQTLQVGPDASRDLNVPPEMAVRPIRRNNLHDRETYYRLWSESGLLPVDISDKGRHPAIRWLMMRPWYGDFCPLLDLEENILFLELKGKPVGFIHWWPNLYKILNAYGKSALSGSENESRELIKKTGEAKIFKIAVSKKVGGKRKKALMEALLVRALQTMSGEFGIERCHISGICLDEQVLIGLLKELKAVVAQEVMLLTTNT